MCVCDEDLQSLLMSRCTVKSMNYWLQESSARRLLDLYSRFWRGCRLVVL